MSDAADSGVKLVSFEVDGQALEAPAGSMLIEATDKAGITVPRFCYHEKLSIAANCRMCLVEVEKAPKPMPACATPVMEGMKVFTHSRLAREAQKGTMEFLLINHPLDCPICDQGGECELQDQALGYGRDVSRFTEKKRVVRDKDIGPLIATDMTRCIHCTRCVRFGAEIAGVRELGATGRGEHTEIGTYIEAAIGSELSGNIIDLCPVGALTSKPFRFKARAWELQQRHSIAPHDSVGSNINIHVRRNVVMRVVPRDNEELNETWISDRDRYSYEGVNSPDRLHTPRVKVEGEWQDVDWELALQAVTDGLRAVLDDAGASKLGALMSPAMTIEELYLAQQVVRGLGSGNIDHRLRQADFRDQDNAPPFPWLGQSVESLDTLDAVLLVGSNVRKEQPIVAHRLRTAALAGAQLMVINPVDYDFVFPLAAKTIVNPAEMVAALAGIAAAVFSASGATVPAGLKSLVASVPVTDAGKAMASMLREGKQATLLLGSLAVAHPDFSVLRALAAAICEAAEVKLGYLPEAADTAGAWLAGAVPHRGPGATSAGVKGIDAQAMLASGMRAFILAGIDPDRDTLNAPATIAALQDADFVVALSCFENPELADTANVILPVSPFTETSGTFVNAEGRWQSFEAAVKPAGDARPGWKVWRVLGNLLGLDGFEQQSSEDVREEVRAACALVTPGNALSASGNNEVVLKGGGLTRVGDVPIYAIDAIVRRATALQQTPDAVAAQVAINPADAEQLGLAGASQVIAMQGDSRATLPLRIDSRVPAGAVWLPAGLERSTTLGPNIGEISLTRASG